MVHISIFQVPKLERVANFIGREWLFRDIDGVCLRNQVNFVTCSLLFNLIILNDSFNNIQALTNDDMSKNRGVMITASVGVGKTSLAEVLVNYSCSGSHLPMLVHLNGLFIEYSCNAKHGIS